MQSLADAAGENDAGGFQNGEMLREVCFGNTKSRLQLGGPALLPAKQIDETKAGRISERLADFSLTPVGFLLGPRLFSHPTRSLFLSSQACLGREGPVGARTPYPNFLP